MKEFYLLAVGILGPVTIVGSIFWYEFSKWKKQGKPKHTIRSTSKNHKIRGISNVPKVVGAA